MSADSVAHQDAEAGASKRRLLSPAGDPLIRAVGRVPAGVHAKLLVAFVGTALLVVVVAVLGLRLLGQSNERVETLGTLQARRCLRQAPERRRARFESCSPRG